MKFMKLGSKVDIFSVHGDSISVASELPSDITFDVDGHKFHLHKFPLLAKWGRLNELIAAARESGNEDSVPIHDFPGGSACFEMCAKYCYGIVITLSPRNVGEVRCGAEFLQMTEATERSNLIYKLEVFLASSILRGWKDAVICLQSSKPHMPWSEDLKIMDRCIEAIAAKTCVSPDQVDWSYSYSRAQCITPMLSRQASGVERSSPATWSGRRMAVVPKDWWVDDVGDLDIDLYRRVILAVKANGAAQDVVAESIRMYSLKCLPEILQEKTTSEGSSSYYKSLDMESRAEEKSVLEMIVSLLPVEKGTSSCSFLLRLLKAATFLDASQSTKLELARRVGWQLEDASLHDLMIPSVSYSTDTVCDVDLVMRIVEHYMSQHRAGTGEKVIETEDLGPFPSSQQQTAESVGFGTSNGVSGEILRMTAATHHSQLKVTRLVDRYLAEIARDTNMPVAKFIQLADSVPDFSRPIHDALYRAIDMYLKEHPLLTKSERKKLCRLMDCKKLSLDACMHAAQNDRLPLRVVVQVLFYDQVRAAVNGGVLLSELPGSAQQSEYGEEISFPEANNVDTQKTSEFSTGDENWEDVHKDFTTLKGDLATIKRRIAEAERGHRHANSSSSSPQCRDHTIKHVKAKGKLISALKPENLFTKLFTSRLGFSSSESSRDSTLSPDVRS